jgi:methyl-accepting chemotaxis protein
LRLNLAAFINNSGEIIFLKTYDLEKGQAVPAPEELGTHLDADSFLLCKSETDPGINGLISLPIAPMMVVSHPILTSTSSGPIQGTLIFGRYLDSIEIARISRITNLSLKGFPVDTAPAPADVTEIMPVLQQGAIIATQELNESIISGYTLLEDIYGQPAITLRVDSSIMLSDQSNRTVFLFTLGMLLFGIIFTFSILVILEKTVISRISDLSFRVTQIGQSGDPSARIHPSGNDEISGLAVNINGMMENLEKTNQEIVDLYQKKRTSPKPSRMKLEAGSNLPGRWFTN